MTEKNEFEKQDRGGRFSYQNSPVGPLVFCKNAAKEVVEVGHFRSFNCNKFRFVQDIAPAAVILLTVYEVIIVVLSQFESSLL